MTLSSIPLAIWRDVLINWLGNLRAIVRIDCAFGFAVSENPFTDVYAERAFPFPGDAFLTKANVLEGLCAWMQSRKVYIGHLDFQTFGELLQPRWMKLFSWTGDLLQSLSYNGLSDSTSKIFLWASLCFTRLQKLKLELRIAIGHDLDCFAIGRILQNVSDSLEYLCVEGDTNDCIDPNLSSTTFPRLLSLKCKNWTQFSVCNILCVCPKLTRLSVNSEHDDANPLLAATIATCCPLLQELWIEENRMTEQQMLQVARGCPLLHRLEFYWSYSDLTDTFVEVVCALPHLHTLVVHCLPETVLLEIAARGHPSLRVVDTSTIFSYPGLRQFTAAMPQLRGLAIYDFDCTVEEEDAIDWLAWFEFCGNLERLDIHTLNVTKEGANLFYTSAAAHCPNLRIFAAVKTTQLDQPGLHAVITNCPRLHTVVVDRPSEFPTSLKRAGLVILSRFEFIAALAPQWDARCN